MSDTFIPQENPSKDGLDVVNLSQLKDYVFNAHGGEGEVSMKFPFEWYKGKGKWSFFSLGTFKKGTNCGYHKHEGNDEFFFIQSGKAKFNINGKIKGVSTNDCILINSGDSHSIFDVEEDLHFMAVEVNR